jgi:DNA-binding NtrC family response regulator
VRELSNVIERILIFKTNDTIFPEDLPEDLTGTGATASAPLSEDRIRPLADVEKQAILEALESCGGNRTRAAELLGVTRNTIINKLRAYGIGQNNGKSS